ncbi:hypothetical protein G4B88_018633 [Cannabis sativa]|uniref:RNase H type-1 domain-containing protein n=1 Tax=Cannabis sativa TaxID=3483 RepID=A0A7J6HGP1_CANSA|nr:hypothetical protein G4B88_018633 [Cannabis sativa]
MVTLASSAAMAAATYNLSNIIFQSDFFEGYTSYSTEGCAISCVNIREPALWFFEAVAKLNLWEIQWIPRRCNDVAHNVAQWDKFCETIGEVSSQKGKTYTNKQF